MVRCLFKELNQKVGSGETMDMDYFKEHAWFALKEKVGKRLCSATFDKYETKLPEQKKLVDSLREYTSKIVENHANGVSIILLGTCGVGKDHLSFCIANAAHTAGLTVNWTNGEDLFADARDAIDSRSTEAELLAKYSEPDYLWMSDPLPPSGDLTDWQKRFLYRIIDSRYRRLKPVIITANVKDQEEFRSRVGYQVADRLMHGGLRWMCKWKSYRSGL